MKSLTAVPMAEQTTLRDRAAASLLPMMTIRHRCSTMCATVTRRRQSTLAPVQDTASEIASKSIELERRIALLELAVQSLLEAQQEQSRRTGALQTQIDHLVARLGF